MKDLLELAQKIYEHDISRGVEDHEAKLEAFDAVKCWVEGTVDPFTMASMADMPYQEFKARYITIETRRMWRKWV